MERYTNEQRILIVKLFYQNGKSFAATVRKLRSIWGHNNAPKESTVKRLMDKFAETGSVSDVKTTTRHRPGRSTENVAAVRDDFAQTPSTSIRHRAQQIGVSKSTLQRILTKDLHLHAYKVQLTQELKPTTAPVVDIEENGEQAENGASEETEKQEVVTKGRARGGKKSAKVNKEAATESPNEIIPEVQVTEMKTTKAASRTGGRKKKTDEDAVATLPEKFTENDNSVDNQKAEPEPPKKKGRGGTKKTPAKVDDDEEAAAALPEKVIAESDTSVEDQKTEPERTKKTTAKAEEDKATEEAEVVKKPTKRGAKDKAEVEKVPPKRVRGSKKVEEKPTNTKQSDDAIMPPPTSPAVLKRRDNFSKTFYDELMKSSSSPNISSGSDTGTPTRHSLKDFNSYLNESKVERESKGTK